MTQKQVSTDDAATIKRMIAGNTGTARGAIRYSHSSHFKAEVFELDIQLLAEHLDKFKRTLKNAGATSVATNNGVEVWHLPEKWKDNIAK